jgi:anion transporter
MLISIGLIALISAIPDLSIHAKVAFITFGLAIIAWTLTDINDTYVALVAAIVFAATGIDEPNEFFETLGDPLIWLLLASFMIAAGIKASGLSERMAFAVTRRARSVRQLFMLLTLVLVATTFLIPSTSGRAALMLPVFLALRTLMPNERAQKALALLFPAVILLSAIASLIGAGAHLITADILWRTGGEYIGFGRWMLMGLPFAIASSAAAVLVILTQFMRREDQQAPLLPPDEALAPTRWSGKERIVAVLAGGLVLFWATESVHGISSTLIAILGALLLTAPFLNVISFKTALKEVDWGMLIFMAATLELGEALIESGGAQWLVENVFDVFQSVALSSPLIVVALVALFGLLSHLVITSRSSRASVITPLVIFLAAGLGFSPMTFAFMTAAATGFCLTLPVSAKPVAMFSKVEGATYQPRDLLRLSGVLLPIHLILLVAFAFLVWPALGLGTAQASPSEMEQPIVWYDTPSKDLLPSLPLINLGENPHKDPISPTTNENSSTPGLPGGDAGVNTESDAGQADGQQEAQADAAEAQAEAAEAQAEALQEAQGAQAEAAEEAQEAAEPEESSEAGSAQPPPPIIASASAHVAPPPPDEQGDGGGDADGGGDSDGDNDGDSD